MCAKPRVYRPYDYADVLVQDYMGLTRHAALALITMLNEFKAQGRQAVGKLASYSDPIDYLQDRGFKRVLLRAVITPLDVQCHDCGGQYTMIRGTITTIQKPPIYCVWCASKNTTVEQENTSEVSFLILAAKYEVPQNVLEYLYTCWSQQAQISSFESYMNTGERLEIRQKLAALASQPTTAS